MKLTVEIDMDNAWFDEQPLPSAAVLLEKVINDISYAYSLSKEEIATRPNLSCPLVDPNGNTCGHYKIS